MPVLTLREGAHPQLVDLTLPVAEALAASGAASVSYDQASGLCQISDAGQIGVVTVGDWQIIIEPKIPMNRIVFLMTYARNPRFWRDDLVNLETDRSMPEMLAAAYVLAAQRALDQGLLKGYWQVEETQPVLRGRIREDEQIRRRFARMMPLEVRYDEFTPDIAENQILLAATQRLLRLPGVGKGQRGPLQRLRLQLADVSVPTVGMPRPTWTPSRLNARYHPALALAELILEGRSFEQRVGEIVVTGYLFGMAKTFEDFVTVALREALRPLGGRSHLQYRTFLDEAGQVPIKPDFVWSERKQPKIVVDAKYKAEKPSGFPQADLYQMLAYCSVLRLPRGHLVYAKGNELDTVHQIREANVTVVAHTLDLSADPEDLLDAVGALAAEMHFESQNPARFVDS